MSRNASTWFINTPFVFLRKRNVKKSVQKKISLIFQSAAGFEPTDTAKFRALKDWSLSSRGHAVVYEIEQY